MKKLIIQQQVLFITLRLSDPDSGFQKGKFPTMSLNALGRTDLWEDRTKGTEGRELNGEEEL